MVRPELGSTDALVMMMDARGMLYELKASALLVATQAACAPACALLYAEPQRRRMKGQIADS